jgi:demethylmenaquinone methyltransferase/2-methoxy-6-polyprenyl-1,4-benzoquinol methylase
VVVLEFGQPGGALFGPLYRWYSRAVIPRVGGLLSGRRDAYEYLDRTATGFPAGARFVNLMLGTGAFAGVTAHPLTGGVAYVYVGEVAAR